LVAMGQGAVFGQGIDFFSFFTMHQQLLAFFLAKNLINKQTNKQQVPKVGRLSTFALLPSNFELRYQELQEDESERQVLKIPHVKTKNREPVGPKWLRCIAKSALSKTDNGHSFSAGAPIHQL